MTKGNWAGLGLFLVLWLIMFLTINHGMALLDGLPALAVQR